MACLVPTAEGNQAKLYWAEEVECWNQDPNGASAAIDWPDPPANTVTKLTELPFTGANLDLQKATRLSGELGSSRVRRRIQQGLSSNGGFGFEWQWAAYDRLLEIAMRAAAWGTPADNTASVTFTASSKTVAGTGIATGIAVGDWVRIYNSTDNDGFYQVATRADADTFTTVQALTDEGPTAAVEVYTAKVADGTAKSSVILEVEFPDITDGSHVYWPGQRPNFSLNVTERDATGRFDFVGAHPLIGDDSVGDGSPTAKTTRTPFNVEGNIGLLLADGEVLSQVTGWGLNINNNLTEQRVLKEGLGDIRRGLTDITGRLDVLHYRKDLFDDAIRHTNISLVISFHDTGSTAATHVTGNSYIIEIPRLVFLGGTPQPTSANDPVNTPLTWGAEEHDTYLCGMRAFRFPAP